MLVVLIILCVFISGIIHINENEVFRQPRQTKRLKIYQKSKDELFALYTQCFHNIYNVILDILFYF